MSATKRELLDQELVRLAGELVILETQWQKKERVLLFGLSVIPAFVLGGPRWALLFLVATPALLATQAYLLWMRRRECRDLIRQGQSDQNKLVVREQSERTAVHRHEGKTHEGKTP